MNAGKQVKSNGSEGQPESIQAISTYNQKRGAGLQAVCNLLMAEIDKSIPKSLARIWHAMPVWFLGEYPVVGYKVGKKDVVLLFWNGQQIEDEALVPVGKFKAAQVKFADVDQVDVRKLRKWLKVAKSEVWDFREMRGK